MAGKHLGQVLRRAKRPLNIPKGWCLLPQGRKKAERNVTNVFDKPNEQNEALFNYAMARKRRMKSNSDVPTKKSSISQISRLIYLNGAAP
ncbi:MAG: hypothetical protein IJR87_03760, partial [Bacteroidaceae bacterium]|nr:hypothetical protein [Bacteroidaceae bacterium]